MLLGFKRRFAPFVEEGSKTHTLRDRGKRRPFIAGKDVCDCYVDPRQETMRLLGRWPCIKVHEVRIEVVPMKEWIRFGCGTVVGTVITAGVWIDDERLDRDELCHLAWSDGFRNSGRGPAAFVEMLGFWKGRLPWIGDMIHWDYSHPVETAKGRSLVSMAGRR